MALHKLGNFSPNVFRPHKWTSVLPVLQRNLSSSETATALRPFYFAVHPDLFGKYPEQRAVNEDSLKKLNQYIDTLRNNARAIPTHLTFFVRETAAIPKIVPQNLREVRIALLSDCPRETVKTVLRSCNLSLDYVEKVKKPTNPAPSSIRWEGFTAGYTAEEWCTPRPQVYLDTWLAKNLRTAHERLAALRPIEEHIEVLKRRLVEEFGVKDVRWQNSWGLVQYRACLLSLLRLCERHGVDNLHLRDHGLVFGTETGLSMSGDVVLRVDDVQDHWLQMLQKLPKQDALLAKIPAQERHLSALLNNIKVTRRSNVSVLVDQYHNVLAKLTRSIEAHLESNPEAGFDQSLEDVELVIECGSGRLTVSPEGQVLVPHWCPGFLVLDFLMHNAHLAREQKQNHISNQQSQADLLQRTQEKLGLDVLCHDENLSAEQMKQCCEHLLENPRNLGVSLDGCRLRVTQFYSVMSDGEICIPWNWVGAFD